MPGYDSTARVPFAKGGRVGAEEGKYISKKTKWISKKEKPKAWITKKDKSTQGKDVPTMASKGGRIGRQLGGRANLLEEVGRLDAERMNPNRRAEKSRVIGELNKGYNKGGRVGATTGGDLDKMTINKKGQPLARRFKMKKGGDGKWIQKVNKSIKARGTKGKCTPITKPGCTGRAKALAKTFKKMAKKRKAA